MRGFSVADLVVEYDWDAMLLIEILEREKIFMAGPGTAVQCYQWDDVRIKVADDFVPCMA